MTSLPIVERELGIASRKIGSWLPRWIIAIAAVLFGGGWLLIASLEGGMMKGDIFFAILAWACFAYCLLAGLWTTTGTLTREKTDGTLGLLFLTDLRGYDVVLGKMITASLKSFYGVLAVLPVLALPLLMGGVTNDQLWRTIGALLNILIFSLSLGMFFSALSWHTGRAIFWTFFSLLGVTMLPLFYLWSGGVSSFLHFLSPGFAMANASAPVIGGQVAGFVGYWSWLGGGLAVSGALLALASWIIPYRWRETKLREQTLRLAKRPTGDASRPSAVQQAALLDANPAGWLVWRMRTFRVSRRLLMYFMITVGALLLGYMALGGVVIGEIWWIMASLIWGASFWIRLEVARHAVTTIHEAKASGALEQILVTPVDERHFRRGHFAAMVRFWMWPVILLASLPIVAALLSMLTTGWIFDDALFGFSIMGMMGLLFVAVFFGDLFALYYSGCWFALRSNNYSAAFWKTFGFVYLLPTIGSVFLCWLGQFVWLVTDIIFIVWPLTSLQGNFRRVVSGEYGLPYVKPASMGHSESNETHEPEDLRHRQVEQQRDILLPPPKLPEVKVKPEEEKNKPTEFKQMQGELERERFEIGDALDEDFVSTEQVIETSESDPGVGVVEAVYSLEAPAPVSLEDTGEQEGDVEEAIEQSSPEDEPTDDGPITVEFFCETCMGEGVVTFDTEQIFKDQFEGLPIAWNGLLKSIDQLSYDRHFEGENGFLATLDIFEIKGRYDSRPVLAVVLLTPEQKATWEPFLNQEISFSGALVALDAFGKRVYLTLRD